MKKISLSILVLSSVYALAQEKVIIPENKKETTEIKAYKKPIQQGVQTDFLMSYYTQDGEHSAVLGGKGSEKLTDLTPTVIISVPLNDDDILTVDAGIDVYTSASSSNIDPENNTSIWQESTGASEGDVRGHMDLTYSHSSDDRNFIWSANAGFSSEYDYTSIGFGAGVTKLFNDKATEVGLKGQVYIDAWKEILPAEFRTNNPVSTFNPLSGLDRQTYALTANYAQIINNKFQISASADLVYQSGLLSTPFNRVYFTDNPNLNGWDENTIIEASDIEHLPDIRVKIPIGLRGNYYVNDVINLRTYYRFYTDDWGITAHTASIEVPIKISPTFTVYPMYRYYTQSQSDHFYVFGQVDESQQYYTSDYDLSKFDSHQYGAGIRIAPPLGILKYKLPYGKTTRRLKSFDLRYNYYDREDGLSANIVTFGLSFGL